MYIHRNSGWEFWRPLLTSQPCNIYVFRLVQFIWYGRQYVCHGAEVSFIGISLIFGCYSSRMEIYRKMQVPLSPSSKKIGGENVEFKSKCLKICQEAALFSRTIEFLNTDTRGLFCNWRFNWEDYGENCDYLYFKILRYYAEMFCVFMSKFMVY